MLIITLHNIRLNALAVVANANAQQETSLRVTHFVRRTQIARPVAARSFSRSITNTIGSAVRFCIQRTRRLGLRLGVAR